MGRRHTTGTETTPIGYEVRVGGMSNLRQSVKIALKVSRESGTLQGVGKGDMLEAVGEATTLPNQNTLGGR